ncbi:MAG: hypothetical protein JWP72_3550, partial [Massilia sp.]|nr:hypothetical protein [Massilia sp.]
MADSYSAATVLVESIFASERIYCELE